MISLLSYTSDINIGLNLVFITLNESSGIFISEHKEFPHVVSHFCAFFGSFLAAIAWTWHDSLSGHLLRDIELC